MELYLSVKKPRWKQAFLLSTDGRATQRIPVFTVHLGKGCESRKSAFNYVAKQQAKHVQRFLHGAVVVQLLAPGTNEAAQMLILSMHSLLAEYREH